MHLWPRRCEIQKPNDTHTPSLTFGGHVYRRYRNPIARMNGESYYKNKIDLFSVGRGGGGVNSYHPGTQALQREGIQAVDNAEEKGVRKGGGGSVGSKVGVCTEVGGYTEQDLFMSKSSACTSSSLLYIAVQQYTAVYIRLRPATPQTCKQSGVDFKTTPVSTKINCYSFVSLTYNTCKGVLVF